MSQTLQNVEQRVGEASQGLTYVVIDTATRLPVSGVYTDLRRARRRADRMDAEYGAYRYRAIAVEARS